MSEIFHIHFETTYLSHVPLCPHIPLSPCPFKSFSRAALTPSEARNNGQVLKAYTRMTFQLSIKGGNEMNYRIVEKEAF